MPRTVARSAIVKAPKIKPTMHLEGKAAKGLLRGKVGQPVKVTAHGRIVSMGIDRYATGNPPTVTVEIDKTRV